MERIGVRELRQHASRYLSRVKGGETIEVTDRGRPIALLVPVPGDEWRALLGAGRVGEPVAAGDVLDEPPRDHRIDASGELAALREEDR